MIKLDSTSFMTLVKCTECPFWFGYADDREHGWRVGRGHEERAHPGATQATTALHYYEKSRRSA